MAVSEEQVLTTLASLTVPGLTTNLVEAGAVRALEVDDETVRLLIVVSAEQAGDAAGLEAGIKNAVMKISGVQSAEVQVQVMLPTGPQAPPQPAEPEGPAWADRLSGVQRIIAVASGKGGVGKSTVAANLATALAQAGHRVGLLDADIYGPSQQMMTGATEAPMGDGDGKIHPVAAPGGVVVMSLGFIVDPDQPVIWRGPMLMKALEQLFSDVQWGELDYMVVDLPPGTGDVSITLCQNVPLAGTIVVTTPQDIALIDARKGLNMFRRLEAPVLGIVENMAHYLCPSCGHTEHIFGRGGGERTARELHVPFLGAVPLEPAVVSGGDTGQPVVLSHPDSAAAKAFISIAKAVTDQLD